MTVGIDEVELQRLLDGRLPESEREIFLECVDEQPEQWRRVALAFVEEQVLRAELGGMRVEDPAFSPATIAAATKNAATKAPRVAASRSKHWFAHAMAVALALVVGGLLGRSTTAPTGQQHLGQQSSIADTGDGNTYVLFPSLGESTANSGLANNEMVGGEDVQPWLTTEIVSPQSRKAIRDEGYEVIERPIIYIVQDRDGGRYVIPQRHVSLVSNEN